MSVNEFVEGSVKWFDPKKGYGFVVHEGKDVFIHSRRLRESGITIIQDSPEYTLDVGDKLKFRIEIGPKGNFAIEISKVK